ACSAGVNTRARKRAPVGASSARRMRATSHTSRPRPTITAPPPASEVHSRSARAAGVTGRRVAGRRLQLGERLPPLGEEIALLDRMLDEIPRETGVGWVGAMHEAIGIERTVPAEGLQRRPPSV